MKTPRYIRIAGAKNSGKTTVIEALTSEFMARGLRVGTLKHTSHNHEFDKPGSDTHRHAAAGSAASVIVSPDRFVCHASRPVPERLSGLLIDIYDDCDVVLCEGHADLSPAPRPTLLVECVASTRKPLYQDDPDLAAIVSDTASAGRLSEKPVDGPHLFDRSDAGGLAIWLLGRLGIQTDS